MRVPTAKKWERRGIIKWQPRVGDHQQIWMNGWGDHYKSWSKEWPQAAPVLYSSRRRALRVAKRKQRQLLRFDPWGMV